MPHVTWKEEVHHQLRIYPTTVPREGCGKRSIIKRSIPGLNSELPSPRLVT